MTAVDITKDLENATLVVTSVFAASPDRVWRLWADPRQLERWWGPDPTRPPSSTTPYVPAATSATT